MCKIFVYKMHASLFSKTVRALSSMCSIVAQTDCLIFMMSLLLLLLLLLLLICHLVFPVLFLMLQFQNLVTTLSSKLATTVKNSQFLKYFHVCRVRCYCGVSRQMLKFLTTKIQFSIKKAHHQSIII